MGEQDKPGAKNLSNPFKSGQILTCEASGVRMRAIIENLALPDGIGISPTQQRLYWSNMGTPGVNDGSIMSCSLRGSDVATVVPKGGVHTPKQIAVDDPSRKLYFADREGLRIMRCDMDGSHLETLIQTGDWKTPEHQTDPMRWCVGITVSQTGKFFWSQKGNSRGHCGRIFCANIDPSAGNGRDMSLLLQGLPEPIDLYFDDKRLNLYWTDRGELPFGNSLNELSFHSSVLTPGSQTQHRILARNFHDPIGLVVDSKQRCAYVAELGGSVYKCNLVGGGKKRMYHDEDWALSGITRSRL
ncbi:3-hydroxyacyl-CoA dehydrogenase-like protein [Penicillium canescens]|nr:3-hydroxyacyl-CoA dehydrogenase-like protein [Penicillium canescens]